MNKLIVAILGSLFFLVSSSALLAGVNEDCLECHEGDELASHLLEFTHIGFPDSSQPEKEVAEIDLPRFEKSAHAELNCTECHTTATVTHDDDEKEIKKVRCQTCHKDQYKKYAKTVHGEAVLKRDDQFAPTCSSCHGNHYILSSKSPDSPTNILQIPETCGRCHKEGTEMTATHHIDRSNIVAHYSMSIHGKALHDRGLIVAPACTTCHGTHDILQHEDPKSNINKANVAQTCVQCHAYIEKTHKQMVRGQLWQRAEKQLPVCIDCHKPHDLQQAIYDKTITDDNCLECHTDPNIKSAINGKAVSLFVDVKKHESSIHANEPCVKCHYDVHPDTDTLCKDPVAFREYMKTADAGTTAVCQKLQPVNCASCHENEVVAYEASIHSKLEAKNDPDAPDCKFCHGTHDILSKKDESSPIFPLNVPSLCGECHKEGGKSAVRGQATQTNILANYSMSIHGRGLVKSGLKVSASCINCHSSHQILPKKDPASSVNPQKIAGTCGECHLGIFEKFKKSIHSAEVSKSDKKLPVCDDCHMSHSIVRHDVDSFRLKSVEQCGNCHEKEVETYLDTFHGKTSKLGYAESAKCSDCHGSHGILPNSDPNSNLHAEKIVETCRQCHAGSNVNFAGYLPHATHDDKDKYPILFYSFWAMTLLLIGTFSFFGLHTILWLIRGLIDRKKTGHTPKSDVT